MSNARCPLSRTGRGRRPRGCVSRSGPRRGPEPSTDPPAGPDPPRPACAYGAAVALVAAAHGGPAPAEAQGQQSGGQDQGRPGGRDVRPRGLGQPRHLRGGVRGRTGGLRVQGPAAVGGEDRGQRRAQAAERQQPRHQQPALAAYGEDGDQSGEADDGQGRGEPGDGLPVRGQRERVAAESGGAPGPDPAGGEQHDGGAEGAEQQGDGHAAAAAAALGGLGVGFGSGRGYGTHVPHYPLRPQEPWRRFAAPTARSTAAALLRHSLSSSSGTESATTPAPACTYAVPSRSSAVRMAMAVSESPAKSR